MPTPKCFLHPPNQCYFFQGYSRLEQEFAHFGYPLTLVTDNVSTFQSKEFQAWCQDCGITHLTGAPYHPAMNGAAERLVQTF